MTQPASLHDLLRAVADYMDDNRMTIIGSLQRGSIAQRSDVEMALTAAEMAARISAAIMGDGDVHVVVLASEDDEGNDTGQLQ